MTRYLGIDSGFAHPGAAVVDVGLRPSLVAVHDLATKAVTKKVRAKEHILKSDDDARRVGELSDWLTWLVAEYTPDRVVIELPSSGAKSGQAIRGMALGAACCVATAVRLGYRLGDRLHTVTPGDNKLASTGDRFAEKDVVLAAVVGKFPDFSGWQNKTGSRKRSGPDLDARYASADAASAVLAVLKQSSTPP